MKKFFEEHGGVAIIVIVIAVLLLIVGSVKGLDEATGKINGSGVASIVGNAYSSAIDKFKDSFNETLNGTSTPTSGPNGEPLVSKTESQVGKYADIDANGTVDGIIFADLLFGGSGEYGTNGDGKYTITKISSCKDYYVSQNSYTNKLGGKVEVLSPTGRGNSRFYIMALSNIDSNRHDWYFSAYNKMSDYASVTSQNFGSGKQNTLSMIEKWNKSAYGEQNKDSRCTDIWGEVQTQAASGWFVPSRQEWAAFCDQLGITKYNCSSKGIKSSWYWTSSLYSTSYAYVSDFYDGYISNNMINSGNYVRLSATF